MATNRGTGKEEMQSEDFSNSPAEQAADAAFSEASSDASGFDTQLRRFQQDAQLANDRALRAQAELENFRKRMRREMDDERRYASMSLIADLLPVIDNLDRAIAASETAGGDLLQGVQMVQSQFLSTLERHHCRRLGVVGEPFDPTKHQAIAQEASTEHRAGTVTRVMQYGYQLHDRVVRPAHVFVSTGASDQSNQNS